MPKTIFFTIDACIGPPNDLYKIEVPDKANSAAVQQAMVAGIGKSPWGQYFQPARREFSILRLNTQNPWYDTIDPKEADFRHGEHLHLAALGKRF